MPAAKPPTTREAIVEAAAELLDAGGPAAVTFRAVGERVGLSHNAAFKQFHDKESLLAAVASRELRGRATAYAMARDLDPGLALREITRGAVRWAIQNPARFALTYGPWTGDLPELGEAARASHAAFVEAVEAAQKVGAAPAGDPERVAGLISAGWRGIADLALSGHLSRDGKWGADSEDLVDDLLALLAASGTSDSPGSTLNRTRG